MIPNAVHYTPLLKGKTGEYAALSSLNAYDRQLVTPFIDVPIVPQHSGKVPTPEQHYQAQAVLLGKNWGDRGSIFMDSRLVEEPMLLPDGRHAFLLVSRFAADSGIPLIPVTGLRRDDAYQQAVSESARLLGTGVGIRIEDEDLTPDLGRRLDIFLDALRLTPQETSLFLDFREILPNSLRTTVIAAGAAIRDLPYVNEWRSLTVAAGAFPSELGEMNADRTKTLPRTDWKFWNELRDLGTSLPRLPSYGDYAISHPGMIDFDPKQMTVPVGLRYTTPTDFLILKEGAFARHGGAGFVRICRRLVGRPEFSGSAFSWGDQYIDDCAANPRATGGNPGVWRRIGTSHHLTMVAVALRGLA